MIPSLRAACVLLLLLLPNIRAQSLNDIPACSVPCYEEAVSLSGCATNDYVCQCGPATKTATIVNIFTNCLLKACTYVEIETYQSVADDVCAAVGETAIAAEEGKKKNKTGMIVGIVVGVVAFLALLALALFCVFTRRKKSRAKKALDNARTQPQAQPQAPSQMPQYPPQYQPQFQPQVFQQEPKVVYTPQN